MVNQSGILTDKKTCLLCPYSLLLMISEDEMRIENESHSVGRSSFCFGTIASLVALPLLVFALSACNGDENENGNGNGNGGGNGRSFTVTYDGNGHTFGTVPGPSQADENGAFFVTDPGDFRGPDLMDGIKRRFVNWNDKADGSGLEFEAGNYHTALTTHDLILFAHWHPGDEAIRQTGPAGGLVYYDKGEHSDGWRYLELAPVSTEWESVTFGGNDLEITGTSEEIGTGLANTQILVAAISGIGETGKAAQLCDELVFGGHSDWFLPAPKELRAAQFLGTGSNSIGQFRRTGYWTSHALGWPPVTYGQIYNFAQGNDLHSARDTSTWPVRAIRRF